MEHRDPSLGRAICGHPFGRLYRVQRRDGDDRTVVADGRTTVFDRDEDAGQAKVDDALPFVERMFGQEAVGPGAGIGHDDVESAEVFGCQ